MKCDTEFMFLNSRDSSLNHTIRPPIGKSVVERGNVRVEMTTEKQKTYRCPCCKFKTLYGRGQDEICPVCFWHDDGQDEDEAEEVWGGPNKLLSLRQAQANYSEIGAVEESVRRFTRKPNPEEL